jgi:EmrB/QacA subfamily drug resistance transporter
MTVAAPARRGHGHPWLTLLCVTFGLVMVGLDNTIVAVANPTIGRHFNASLGGLQWITNAYLLALAALLITGGKLGDRFGRKRVFIIGMAGFTVASAACGLSVNLPMLAICRAAQGVFGAMLLVQTLAILRATFPVEQIAAVVGIWVGASSVAVATGPLVGGLLVQHIGWRAIFFVNIPVGVTGVVAGAWVIRESKDEESARTFDIPGVLLLTAFLCLLVWTLIHAEGNGWRNITTPAGLAVSALLGVAFIVRERTTPAPLLPLQLFRSTELSAGVVILVVASFASFGITFYMTLYLQRVLGYSPVQAGTAMLALSTMNIVSAPTGGWLVDRVGVRAPVASSFVASAVALVGLSRLGPHSSYMDIWPWFMLQGIASGIIGSASARCIVGNAPESNAGVASGLQITCFQFGGVLGTAVLGSIVSGRALSTLPAALEAQGVPVGIVGNLGPAAHEVAQAVVPVTGGAAAPFARALAEATRVAYCHGLRAAYLVTAVLALGAAVVAARFTSGSRAVRR